jgi:hypothetical protein
MTGAAEFTPYWDERLGDYQKDAIRAMREAARAGHKNILVCAPTRSGKTKIAACLVGMSRRKGKRLAFVVDRNSLINQTSAAFDLHGIDHGVIHLAIKRPERGIFFRTPSGWGCRFQKLQDPPSLADRPSRATERSRHCCICHGLAMTPDESVILGGSTALRFFSDPTHLLDVGVPGRHEGLCYLLVCAL